MSDNNRITVSILQNHIIQQSIIFKQIRYNQKLIVELVCNIDPCKEKTNNNLEGLFNIIEDQKKAIVNLMNNLDNIKDLVFSLDKNTKG